MSVTEIGVDLGEFEIKLAYVQEVKNHENKINHLKYFETYPVSCKMYSQEYFNILKNAIKNFSKKIKKNKISLNFAVSHSKGLETLLLTVPQAEKKDIDAGVKFEAEQINGSSFDGYKTLWKKVKVYEEDKKMDVLFNAMNSKIITPLSKFKTINWKVSKIVPQGVVLERFAKDNDIVLDFGYKNSRVYFYEEGRLKGVENFPIGYYQIEEKVKEFLQEKALKKEDDEFYDFVDSMYMASSSALLVKEDPLVSEASKFVEPMILNLISEAKKSIRSFELKSGIYLDNIYYTGSLFNFKYLSSVVSSELDMILTPLETVAKDTEENKYEIASLVAISQTKPEKMNFAQFIGVNIDFSSIAFGVFTAALSAGLIFAGVNNKYDNLIETQSQTLLTQSSTVKDVESNISSYENISSRADRYSDLIDQVSGKHDSWLSLSLNMLTETTPSTISIKNVTIDGNNIKISGYSTDYSSIGFFAEKLKKHGNVEITSIEDYKKKKKLYSIVTNDSDLYQIEKEFELSLTSNGDGFN